METLVASFEQHLRQQGFELIETHLSRVFLGERDVYKFKRPVNLGFVDFTTREARRLACQAELTLNRRLAPEVYLDVPCLWADAAGLASLHRAGPEQASQDHEWLVHMQRLPDARRADALLARSEFDQDDIDEVARMLVAFHRAARCDEHTTSFGRASCIERNVEENLRQISMSLDEYLSQEESEHLFGFQREFLRANSRLFETRCEAQRVRDGHGDLRLEHLYRKENSSLGSRGQPRASNYVAIDCIEFNERFRFADVCADLAFLVMDLDYHQRRDLAERLVLRYAQESADYGLYALLDFYVSYRAVVRAKISAMLAADPDVSETTRRRAAFEARRYYLLALSAGNPALEPPALIAMAGGIATGKSTLAEALGRVRTTPVLTADRVRKELLGVAPTQPLHTSTFQGAYDEATTGRVYDELLERAEHVLASGRSVILDASFRSRSQRQKALTLAERHGVPALFTECRCSQQTTETRLAERSRAPSLSDGRAEIQGAFLQSFEPLTELPSAAHCVIDSERPLEENVTRVLSRLFV